MCECACVRYCQIYFVKACTLLARITVYVPHESEHDYTLPRAVVSLTIVCVLRDARSIHLPCAVCHVNSTSNTFLQPSSLHFSFTPHFILTLPILLCWCWRCCIATLWKHEHGAFMRQSIICVLRGVPNTPPQGLKAAACIMRSHVTLSFFRMCRSCLLRLEQLLRVLAHIEMLVITHCLLLYTHCLIALLEFVSSRIHSIVGCVRTHYFPCYFVIRIPCQELLFPFLTALKPPATRARDTRQTVVTS